MNKIESKYHFSSPYTDKKGIKQLATVVLTINYRAKNYSIIPYCGTTDFVFRNSSHEWIMWKAILKSINEAIDFANNELDKTE